MTTLFLNHWQALSPSQKQALAERMDSSVTYLSMLANGHRCPSSRFAELLASATGCGPFEFSGCMGMIDGA